MVGSSWILHVFCRDLTELADGRTGRHKKEDSWEEWVEGGQELSFTSKSEMVIRRPIEGVR